MHKLSLNSRLVLLMLVSVLPLIGFNLVSVYRQYQQDRWLANQETVEIARRISGAIDGELHADMATLQVLASSGSLARGDINAFRAQVEQALSHTQRRSAVLLFRENGQQVMNTALPPGAPLPRRQNELQNLARVFATGEPSVADVYIGQVNHLPIVAVEVPVFSSDGHVGLVLSMTPTLNVITSIVEHQNPGANWRINIVDRTGRRIARVPDSEGLTGSAALPNFLSARASTPEGTLPVVGPEGLLRLAGYTPVPDAGWTVAVAIPETELITPIWQTVQKTFLAGAGCSALGSVLAHMIARSVVQPMSALRKFAAVAMDAEPRTPIATGLMETDEVAGALLTEARERHVAMVQLAQRNEDLERSLSLNQ